MGTCSAVFDPKTTVSRSKKVVRRQLVRYADVLRSFPYPGVLKALDVRDPHKAYQLRIHWVRLHMENEMIRVEKKQNTPAYM